MVAIVVAVAMDIIADFILLVVVLVGTTPLVVGRRALGALGGVGARSPNLSHLLLLVEVQIDLLDLGLVRKVDGVPVLHRPEDDDLVGRCQLLIDQLGSLGKVLEPVLDGPNAPSVLDCLEVHGVVGLQQVEHVLVLLVDGGLLPEDVDGPSDGRDEHRSRVPLDGNRPRAHVVGQKVDAVEFVDGDARSDGHGREVHLQVVNRRIQQNVIDLNSYNRMSFSELKFQNE